MRLHLLVTALLAFSASHAMGQQVSPDLPPVAVVRVTAPAHVSTPVTGMVLQWSEDSLVIGRNLQRHAIPSGAIERLQVRQGRNRSKGAMIGGAIGAFAGILAFEAAFGNDPYTSDAAAPVGLAVGAAGGLLIGALAAPERWTDIPLPDRRR